MSVPGKSAEAPERARPASDDLEEAIGKLELPMVLIDLNDFTVCAVSRAALKRFGMAPGALVGQPLLGAILDADRQRAMSALQAMRDGAIDFYRATTRISARRNRRRSCPATSARKTRNTPGCVRKRPITCR